ncbi:MAG: TRAP transporter substrate-binding protein [Sphaerochaeta sp.]|nr:TRAP transporter substrate-binding protein [Sphaerochaeta sp.]
MKMHRIMIAVLLVALIVTPLFAGGTAESGKAAKKITVNVASVFPPEGPIHELMVNFKSLVEERSDKRIQVVVHPSGALGGEREVVEAIASGTVEMAAQGIMDLIMYMPEYTVFEEPFVIRDIDHLRKFWATIGQEMNELLEEKAGIITAAIAVRGSRMITANKPIVEPEDLKGLKFRLPQYPVRIKVFEAFGAIPTVVDFPEVYMALKTKTVDAQENPPETIYTYKYNETQKYLINTQHVWSTARYQISKKWFDTLTTEDQTLIMDAWKDAESHIKEIAFNPDITYVKKLVDSGMILVEPNAEAFRKISDPVMREFDKTQWAPGLRQRIMDL